MSVHSNSLRRYPLTIRHSSYERSSSQWPIPSPPQIMSLPPESPCISTSSSDPEYLSPRGITSQNPWNLLYMRTSSVCLSVCLGYYDASLSDCVPSFRTHPMHYPVICHTPEGRSHRQYQRELLRCSQFRLPWKNISAQGVCCWGVLKTWGCTHTRALFWCG